MSIRDEIHEQELKFKDMDYEQKKKYIWDYYRYHIIIACFFVFFFIIFAMQLSQSLKPYALNVIATNTNLDYIDPDFTNDFGIYAGIDTSKNKIVVDYSNNFYLGSYDYTSTSVVTKIQTLAKEGTLDILIAEEEDLNYLAELAICSMDVRQMMPDDILELVGDKIYTYESQDGIVIYPGFYMDDAPRLIELGLYDYTGENDVKHILAIIPTSENLEYVWDFIRYIYEVE